MGDDGTAEPDPTGARERLERRRRDAVERLRSLRGDLAGLFDAQRDTATDDEHDPEGATLAFERAQADALAQAALEQVTEIDAALRRLESGDYGRCEACGEPISPGRLEARPAARTCIRCASRS
ncbi:TraR/DksA C4-type zinc finger protein [Cellulomonas cellasea]|uniref:TraR/DksA family transcriptional regulator n=1 Tax=Cellulomonas cellasea TaxID=43670 RepID=UPI0025A42BE9|nr:TraR/DksA C4-type zinc finger protein [Cellulomonas cellasea]MDM8083411.1 TraR/DksA C4-type zinc finger protein [Cellulomonas cellasea]